MPRQFQFTIIVPTVPDFNEWIRRKLDRWQKPLGTPNVLLRGLGISTALFNMLMGASLFTLGGPSNPNNPVSPASPWRDIYAVGFFVAGVLALLYAILLLRLTKSIEINLRLAVLATSLIAALGWTFLLVLNAVAFQGDWARVVPWIFASYNFARTAAIRLEFIDRAGLDHVARTMGNSD